MTGKRRSYVLPAFSVVACGEDYVEDVDVTAAINVAVGANVHLNEGVIGITNRENRCRRGF